LYDGPIELYSILEYLSVLSHFLIKNKPSEVFLKNVFFVGGTFHSTLSEHITSGSLEKMQFFLVLYVTQKKFDLALLFSVSSEVKAHFWPLEKYFIIQFLVKIIFQVTHHEWQPELN